MPGFNAIGEDAIGVSDSLLRVQRSFSLAYQVQQRVQRSFSLAYTVAGAVTNPVLTRVQRSFSLAYQVRQRVQRSFSLAYTVVGVPPPEGNFTPSVARTIQARPGGLASIGGDFWDREAQGPTGSMDPDSQIDVTMDWRLVLDDIKDTIASADVLVVGAQFVGGYTEDGRTTVFVDQPSGSMVSIRFRITTASTPERIEDRTVFLKVAQQ